MDRPLSKDELVALKQRLVTVWKETQLGVAKPSANDERSVC